LVQLLSYIASKDATEFLAPILVSALQSTIKNMENHLSRLQFKTAVELNMMMNVLASELDTTPETLDQMRGRCIQEVKETCGEITFKDAVKYQRIG